ncbi:MAG: nicotinate (nicotinamide) nucleotide adenylyltransferase [Oscillospiraceae bacterium]|nr:nicotinate (nicotinamide) nucleotide adenylyltransferase [Oscillospiraceae bacterium]
MRVGLFGGSFNPIHNGHLHLAESVKTACGLDYVLLMPTGTAPHKSSAAYVDADHRYAMCQLAARAYDWLAVSDYEIRKDGKSYTVETLAHLKTQYPHVAWTLMIGSDMLLTFDRWYRWMDILEMAAVCVVSRQPGDEALLRQKAEALQQQMQQCGKSADILVLSVAALPVSSTQIREKMQKNENCSCLLPENVVQYMNVYGLYR